MPESSPGANPPSPGTAAPAETKRLEDPVESASDRAADVREPPAPVSPGPAAAAPAPTGWAPPRSGRLGTVITLLVAVVGILVVLYAWRLPPFTSAIESTDNAYVRGQTTVVSPQTSGYVAEVPVQDFQRVRAGDVLARIDDRIYRQRVEQARATLAGQVAALANSAQTRLSREATVASQLAAVTNAKAQLARAKADMDRVDALVKEGSISLRERDQTRASLRQAQAAVEQARAAAEIARQDVRSVTVNRAGLEAAVEGARAALQLAEIDLSNTVIRAPRDGHLSEVGVRAGQYVTAGTQLMFLVPDRLWIIANYKEAQTEDMAPGQAVHFRVDALGKDLLTGRVEQLAPAAGSEFAVLRPDNATGNFVKVAQRISVRIEIDPDQPLAERLRPGMSVETRVDTRSGPTPARTIGAQPRTEAR
jgi:multidrug resistance efflux pump